MNQNSLRTLKSSAKQISRDHQIPYSKALDIIAEREGYSSWSLLMNRYNAESIDDMQTAWCHVLPLSLGLIAASQNVGKMSLAINLCLRAAKEGGDVAYISAVHSSDTVKNKFAAVNSEVEQTLFAKNPDDIPLAFHFPIFQAA